MTPLFPTPISHTPPEHCVRMHRLQDGPETVGLPGYVPKSLAANIHRLRWLKDSEPQTTAEIAERIFRTRSGTCYILYALADAGIIRKIDGNPIRWEWVGAV